MKAPARPTSRPSPSEIARLRTAVKMSLRSQGFELKGGLIVPPETTDKAALRRLHESAVAHRVAKARKGLARYEKELAGQLAGSHELSPRDLAVDLVEVERGSRDELLFRWAALHWSIPVSSGYGRRLRFLVKDSHNGKLVGLVGLGDPVFALAARDRWIGWTRQQSRERLVNVVDAFVLGAVPPYSSILAGKLVALLATSSEVRQAWRRKYAGAATRLSRTVMDGELALITTTSALGRSAIYNRLRFGAALAYVPVGFTRGSGEFHFSDGLHEAITTFAERHCEPTAKRPEWGVGFRNRREVVKKALPLLGFSDQLLYHGVQREMFVAPVALNYQRFLRGEDVRLVPVERPASAIQDFWRERWMYPRLGRMGGVPSFEPNSWRLWPE